MSCSITYKNFYAGERNFGSDEVKKKLVLETAATCAAQCSEEVVLF